MPAVQRVRSRAKQNEMKNVLGRMTTDTAQRTLNFAKSRDKSQKEDCVRCSEDE